MSTKKCFICAFCVAITLFIVTIFAVISSPKSGATSRVFKMDRTIVRDTAVNDGQTSDSCDMPSRPSKELAMSIRRIKNATCRRKVLNLACLLEKGHLYKNRVQSACDKTKSPAHLPLMNKSATLAFLILVRGRQIRQIKRLLINIYRPNHSYFFFIDSCSSYMFNQLKIELGGHFANIYIHKYNNSNTGTCGDVDDFELTQSALEHFLVMMNKFSWDYLIKLNEFDFPIMNIDDISRFFALTYPTNFLEFSNSSNNAPPYILTTCESGKYIIGPATAPQGLTVARGPSWFALTKDFIQYSLDIEREPLIRDLLKWLKYVENPGEIFYHTLIHNSPFCHRLEPSQLFVRKANGSVFDHRDFLDLNPEENMIRLHLFAQNLQSTVNQQIIDNVESIISPQLAKLIETSTYKNYWNTVWNGTDDGPLKNAEDIFVSSALSSIGKRLRRCSGLNLNLKPLALTTLRRFDTLEGFLLNFESSCSNVQTELEAFVQYRRIDLISKPNPDEMYNNARINKELLSMSVVHLNNSVANGLRRELNIIGVEDKLKLVTNWVQGDRKVELDIVWLNPTLAVKGLQKMNVSKTMEHFEIPAKLPDVLDSGVWTVQIAIIHKVIGQTEFLVLPQTSANYAPNDQRYSESIVNIQKSFNKFYHVKRLCVAAKSRNAFGSCGCRKPELPICEQVSWSSFHNDPKSDINTLLIKS